MKELPQVLIVFGPTGSGKTGFAQTLSEDYEIVSCDSRQIYRYTEVGSAAPAKEELEHHHYHLVGFLDPREVYDAAAFCAAAAGAVSDILKRGRRPAIVGGTGFYLRNLLMGMWTAEPDSQAVRRAEEIIAQDKENPGVAWKQLQRLDARRAEAIHQNDRYRLERALQMALSGYDIERLNNERYRPFKAESFDILAVEIRPDRAELYERINKRAGLILQAGMIDEYKNLLAKGFTLDDPGLTSLGYNYIDQHLHGSITFEQLVDKLAQSHRHYAKKQLTYFRTQLQIQKNVGVNFEMIDKWVQNWEKT